VDEQPAVIIVQNDQSLFPYTVMGLLIDASLIRFLANFQASSIKTNVGMNPVIIQRTPSIISIIYKLQVFYLSNAKIQH
jgi:hypothetical protein